MRTLPAALALASLLVLASCPQKPPVGPPVSVQGSDCAAACTKLVQLGCTPARTPDGHTCQEVCIAVEATGVVSWNTPCIVDIRVQTCDAVKACHQ